MFNLLILTAMTVRYAKLINTHVINILIKKK